MPVGKPFQRGQPSANPKGRPRSLKAAVQERVGDDGARIVEELFKIATDRRLKGHNGARVRMAAWCELRDMGFGKPQASLALEGTLDSTVTSVVFGGRFLQGGQLQDEPVQTRSIPRSADRRAPMPVDDDAHVDSIVADMQRPAGALPAASVPTPEPAPEDPAESAWTEVS
jgi:hypothetical protein